MGEGGAWVLRCMYINVVEKKAGFCQPCSCRLAGCDSSFELPGVVFALYFALWR